MHHTLRSCSARVATHCIMWSKLTKWRTFLHLVRRATGCFRVTLEATSASCRRRNANLVFVLNALNAPMVTLCTLNMVTRTLSKTFIAISVVATSRAARLMLALLAAPTAILTYVAGVSLQQPTPTPQQQGDQSTLNSRRTNPR